MHTCMHYIHMHLERAYWNIMLQMIATGPTARRHCGLPGPTLPPCDPGGDGEVLVGLQAQSLQPEEYMVGSFERDL